MVYQILNFVDVPYEVLLKWAKERGEEAVGIEIRRKNVDKNAPLSLSHSLTPFLWPKIFLTEIFCRVGERALRLENAQEKGVGLNAYEFFYYKLCR